MMEVGRRRDVSEDLIVIDSDRRLLVAKQAFDVELHFGANSRAMPPMCRTATTLSPLLNFVMAASVSQPTDVHVFVHCRP